MKKQNRQLSLRLPEYLLREIIQASEERNETKSVLVKKSIIAFLDYYKKVQRPHLTHQNIFCDLK